MVVGAANEVAIDLRGIMIEVGAGAASDGGSSRRLVTRAGGSVGGEGGEGGDTPCRFSTLLVCSL